MTSILCTVAPAHGPIQCYFILILNKSYRYWCTGGTLAYCIFDENYYSGVVCSNVMVSASLYNTNCICYLFIVKIAVVWNNCTHSEGKLYGVFPCKAAVACMRYACILKLTPVCMVYFMIQPPAILFCVYIHVRGLAE